MSNFKKVIIWLCCVLAGAAMFFFGDKYNHVINRVGLYWLIVCGAALVIWLIAALIAGLLRHLPKNIDEMSGVQFEEYCAGLLRKNGAGKIEGTKATGDQGVDLIVSIRDRKIAVQCKRLARPVGNKAVQEVIAGMQFYECDAGIVMTNNTFTRGAYELAEAGEITLWDREDLVRLERKACKEELRRM